ncbi:MAG: hypothetical protein ABR509_08670 [Candidatus Limnocylindria bacterium]
MPKSTRTRDAASAPDPDRLVRSGAGTYRTADDRFEVRESGGAWFLVDTTQADEFGQELVRGPFPTRSTAADALPSARRPPPTPLRNPSAASRAVNRKSKPKPPPPPPSWIDGLPKSDAAALRALIGALERKGIPDAEEIVRRDREGGQPEVAARLIAARLEAIVESFQARQRAAARDAVEQVAALLTREGERARSPLPGWTLVEVPDARARPGNRRIEVDPSR